MREKTIKNILKMATEKGGKCLSKKYTTINIKLKWKCAKGHIWEATAASVKMGRWCPVCAIERRRLTINKMREIAIKRKGKCLSRNYINNRSKLKWECSKRHVWEASPCNITNGQWCPECRGKKKLTLSQMQNIAKEHGGECLSDKYINAYTKLKWKCVKGHEWETDPRVIRRGHWCPECGYKH